MGRLHQADTDDEEMTRDYQGPERRKEAHLSEAQLDDIAARLETRVYTSIGRGLVRKAVLVVGAALGALYLWLTGKIPPPPTH